VFFSSAKELMESVLGRKMEHIVEKTAVVENKPV